MTTEKYYGIRNATSSLFKDRGSKFLGYAYPVTSVEQAKTHLQEIKKEHAKATHHCFAYRIGTDGLIFRASDDGEPSGSAGKPILGQIDSAGLCNVLVIVVRYYGGTMLGVPGLINAYKTAAAEALEQAERVEKWICRTVEISLDYNALGEVLYLLRQAEAEVLHQELQLFCTIRAAIPEVYYKRCEASLLQIRGLNIKMLSS